MESTIDNINMVVDALVELTEFVHSLGVGLTSHDWLILEIAWIDEGNSFQLTLHHR